MSTQEKPATGIKLTKDNSNISYLMFIDDCFCRELKQAARELSQSLITIA